MLSAETCREVVRDSNGRITGTTTNSSDPAGPITGIRLDASSRVIGTGSGSGKCQSGAPVPLPPSNSKK